jgi:hypothetical protein
VNRGESGLDSELGSERGSVTAELAFAMPSVALVLVITLGGFGLQVERLKLVSEAAVVARALGRGEAEADVRSQLAEVDRGVTVKLDYLEDYVCTTVSRIFEIAALQSFEVSERQCARKSGL